METRLKDIIIELSNMKNILEKIFTAILEGGQVNNASITSTNNNTTSF